MVTAESNDLCKCGKESTVGTHLVRDGQVVDRYFCDEHWNRQSQKETCDNEEESDV